MDDFPTRMAPADSLMWRIEADPVLRSTITAVSLLDRAPDWDEVRARIVRAGLAIPRLRQRVAPAPLVGGSPHWEPDPNFDLDYHLRRLRLAPPATLSSVLGLAATGAAGGFDRSRPLWEFLLVEGLEGGQAAFVQKIHHAVTDGIAGLRMAAQLLDLEREPAAGAAAAAGDGATDLPPLEPPPRRGIASRASGAATSLLSGAARVATGTPAAALHGAVRLAGAPLGSARAAGESARWAARLLRPVAEPRSPLMRGRGTSFRFEVFDVDLPALRAAGHAAGGKLNDAFLAAVTDGMARYHALHGAAVPALRMLLPVSIRDPQDPLGSNRFTPLRFDVPIGDDDVAGRIRALHELAATWREGPALGLTDLLARWLDALPGPLPARIFGRLLRGDDFVATNVPGFPQPLYLGGAEIVRMYAFAPPAGAAVNVALVSHAGRCCIGVNCDAAAVPDPEVLVGCLREGFDEVLGAGHLATPVAAAR